MKDSDYKFLEEKLMASYGSNFNKIISGFREKRRVSLRINTLLTSIEECKNELEKLEIAFLNVPFFANALIILNKTERELEETKLYKEGKIYLQSLSSMLPPLYLEVMEKQDILDMAAAPGGKTTEIAILTNGKALITACEKNKIRAERLKYNLNKQSVTNVNLLIKDASLLDDFFSFDRILLDAPCTGSGTVLLEDNNSKQEFQEKHLNQITKIQKNLISKAIKILKKNGILIYSTCSLFKEENEMIVDYALNTKKVKLVPIEKEDFIPYLDSKYKETITVCPNQDFEGFFVAKFIKL